MIKKIALEEHFLSPELEEYWWPTVKGVEPGHAKNLHARLTDFGDVRLQSMDQAGIARSVLAIAGPGVQAERDAATATKRARQSNDFLAREIQKRSDRYSGFAHLGMQDPGGAADELERCMRDLKFCGAMINGHTHGQYLDHPSLYPFWERAEALGATIYIHPTDPIAPSPALEGVHGLRRATWEWGFETGSHALRLVFSGLFDRFPRARLMLGHLGETLPFLLWRFDSRAKLYSVKLVKAPSDYIKQNIVVTTSGMCSTEPLNCSLAALGKDRVMFGADYPFESAQEAGEFLDHTPLAEPVRADVAYGNAARYLGSAAGMTKVLIVDVHAEMYRDALRTEFPALQFVLFHKAAEVGGDLSDIDVMVMFGIELRDFMLSGAPKLKWIQSLATGVDHFLRSPSLRPDVLITSGRGIHGPPMREQVIYMMMGVSRDVVRLAGDQKAHFWQRRLWSTLHGKTAVIAGTGIVGSAIGEALRALGMKVIGVSRSPRKEAGFDEMIATDKLTEAAARADYLINMLPASGDNIDIFDAKIFGAMKPTAYYISAGRGQTVDEDAMLAALRDRKIAGAALEVFKTEPLPKDSAFWDLPNVFITPHVGGYVVEYEDFIMPLVVDNMRLFLAGKQSEMQNIVKR